MSDQDDYAQSFHEMKELMAPPPELLSRLDQALEDAAAAAGGTVSANMDAAGVNVAKHDAGGVNVAKSDAGGLDVAKHDSAGLDSARPDSAGLESVGLESVGLDSARPDSAGLDSAGLDSARPDSARLDSGGSDSARPDSTRPDSTRPVGSLPPSPRKNTRPSGRVARRLGVFSGAGMGVILAGVMVLTSLGNGGSGSSQPQFTPAPLWSGAPVALTSPGTSPASAPATAPAGTPPGSSVDLTGYAKVYQALMNAGQSYLGYAVNGSALTSGAAVPAAAGSAEGDSAATNTDYSTTNVQVAGIDEADIVKTDGDYLYIARGRTIAIVAASGADSHQVAAIDTSGLTSSGEVLTGPVMDMMIDGTTLAVFIHGFSADTSNWSRSSGEWISMSASSLKTLFYDISDPANPRFLSLLSQSGTYVDSRLSGDVLYLVSRYSVDPTQAVAEDPSTFAPVVGLGGATPVPLAPGDITILPGVSQPTYSLVTAIDLTGRTLLSEQAVLGWTDTIYMSQDNLYLAASQWYYQAAGGDPLSTSDPIAWDPSYSGSRTDLVRIALDGGQLSIAAQGTVPGILLNQFALDEWQNNLRLVTTVDANDKSQQTNTPALWVLDSSFNLVGSIGQLSQNESIQSVRFEGGVGYVVTFRQVDPLFAVDLSNPAKPTVLSALKVPGFSSYLHPFGDGLLLGIGVDADASGVTTGLKLSMYNISDPNNVQEIATTVIEGTSTEVSQDHKAAFVDTSRDLIGFPSQTWQYSVPDADGTVQDKASWDYHIYSWNGSAFVDQAEINLFSGNPYQVPDNLYDATTRGVRVGEDFYIAADSQVNVYTMTSYAQIAAVTLA